MPSCCKTGSIVSYSASRTLYMLTCQNSALYGVIQTAENCNWNQIL